MTCNTIEIDIVRFGDCLGFVSCKRQLAPKFKICHAYLMQLNYGFNVH